MRHGLAILSLIFLTFMGIGSVRAQSAKAAMERLSASDNLFRNGRLGMAYAGYIQLIREFPTWWLPTIKAAVVARAIGLPEETVVGYLLRAARLSATGGYIRLVGLALNKKLEINDDTRLEAMENRIGMLAARSGSFIEKKTEYEKILERSPRCMVARWKLAHALAENGQTDDAVKILKTFASESLFPPRWRTEAERMERSNGERGR